MTGLFRSRSFAFAAKDGDVLPTKFSQVCDRPMFYGKLHTNRPWTAQIVGRQQSGVDASETLISDFLLGSSGQLAWPLPSSFRLLHRLI